MTAAARRPRVVVAGLGDTGVLTAVRLARRYDVVGVSGKPALVSGQELGLRLADPQRWARDYRVPFGSYRGLDRVRVVQGLLRDADLRARTVEVEHRDRHRESISYDVLVVSTGVSNGFWRQPGLQSAADVDRELAEHHERLTRASSIVVVGGGAAAVSAAYNLARTRSRAGVHIGLHYPGERALPHHHHRVWDDIAGRLERAGVTLNPGHRAVVPSTAALAEIGCGPVGWSTGQPPTQADAVIWAVGRSVPNTSWLPAEALDDEGFVRVGPDLRVQGVEGVFAVGDVAATDLLRSSARNFAHRVLVRNVRAHLEGGRLHHYRPPHRRWGSVLGPQPDGLTVYAPTGRPFRVPRSVHERLVQPIVVARGLYLGIRQRRPGAS